VLLALQPPPPAADGPSAPQQTAGGPPSAPDGNPIAAPDADGRPAEQQTLQEARQALADAIVESGTEVTVEQALELLDLVRLVNRLQELDRSDYGGNFPPR
jgi:hypothetical protein